MKKSKSLIISAFMMLCASYANGMMMQRHQLKQKEQSEPMVSVPQVAALSTALPKKRTILDAVFPIELINTISGGKHNPLKDHVVPYTDVGLQVFYRIKHQLMENLPIKQLFMGKHFCLSPNGQYIIVTADKLYKLYNLQTGEVEMSLANPASDDYLVGNDLFSPDSKRVMLWTGEYKYTMYDIISRQYHTIQGNVRFSKKGDHLFITNENREASVYDLRTKQQIFSGESIIEDECFGNYIGVNSGNTTKIYDMDTPVLRLELPGKCKNIMGQFAIIDCGYPTNNAVYNIENKKEIFETCQVKRSYNDKPVIVFQTGREAFIYESKTGKFLIALKDIDDARTEPDSNILFFERRSKDKNIVYNIPLDRIIKVKGYPCSSSTEHTFYSFRGFLALRRKRHIGLENFHKVSTIGIGGSSLATKAHDRGIIQVRDVHMLYDLINSKLSPTQLSFLLLLDEYFRRQHYQSTEPISLLTIAKENKLSLRELQNTLATFDHTISKSIVEGYAIIDPTKDASLALVSQKQAEKHRANQAVLAALKAAEPASVKTCCIIS